MPYHLDESRFAAFPDDATVGAALAEAGLPRTALETTVRAFVCPAPPVVGFGYQQSIAVHLEAYLRAALAVPPLQEASGRVSPTLNEKADLVIALGSNPTCVRSSRFQPAPRNAGSITM